MIYFFGNLMSNFGMSTFMMTWRSTSFKNSYMTVKRSVRKKQNTSLKVPKKKFYIHCPSLTKNTVCSITSGSCLKIQRYGSTISMLILKMIV